MCGYESKILDVAIVTSVWEHVDGVSRTMKRVIEHLKNAMIQVMVVSPDLAEDYQSNTKRKRRKRIPILTLPIRP